MFWKLPLVPLTKESTIMMIEAEAHLTLDAEEVRIVKFDLPLPYVPGVLTEAIEATGLKLRDVRKAVITY